MGAKLLLQEKHDLLMTELSESLEKKHALELKISRMFEELKGIEVTLERRPREPK
jgi:hypothetical protein